jgi:hypothetical protein
MVMRARMAPIARSQRALVARHFSAAATSKYNIKTYNAISPKGLERYPKDLYSVGPDVDDPHAIMLRSHGLQDECVLTYWDHFVAVS